jgi:hypothetical protein
MQNNGRRGKDNPNWKGGITEENRAIRSSKQHKEWSKSVLEHDNYTCQACRKRGGDLHANHILDFSKYPKFRFLKENGIALCHKCHYTTYKFHGNQFKNLASIENGVNSEKFQDFGELRAKLLDEIRKKRCVTVKDERIAIIPISAPPEKDDMT